MMIKVSITDEMLLKAKKEANRRMAFGFRTEYPVSDSYKFDMIYISCVGELVVQEYLNNKKASYSFADRSFPGKELSIKGRLVEITTSGYGDDFSKLNLLYNDRQYAESISKGISYVVQVFINGYQYKKQTFCENKCNTGYIVGYIEFNEIGKYPIVQNVNRPNYKVALSNLKSFDSII